MVIVNLAGCGGTRGTSGTQFPDLIYQEGDGTLLLFSTEDQQFLLSEPGLVGEAGTQDELNSRIGLFLNMIEDEYPDIRIEHVDIAEDRQAATRFQIYDIPTLVLINKYGREHYRWLPVDFEISGGSINWLKKEIDKMISDYEAN